MNSSQIFLKLYCNGVLEVSAPASMVDGGQLLEDSAKVLCNPISADVTFLHSSKV